MYTCFCYLTYTHTFLEGPGGAELLDDAHAAVLQAWAGARKPIILVGDSAGGNLAAALSHRFRDSPIPIIGQVLIYPGLGGDMEQGSYLTHAHAPMLTTEEVRFYASIRCDSIASIDDPTITLHPR